MVLWLIVVVVLSYIKNHMVSPQLNHSNFTIRLEIEGIRNLRVVFLYPPHHFSEISSFFHFIHVRKCYKHAKAREPHKNQNHNAKLTNKNPKLLFNKHS